MANYKNQKRMDILNVELLEHKSNTPTEGYYPPMEYTYIDAAATELKKKGIIIEDTDSPNKLYFNAVPDEWRQKYG